MAEHYPATAAAFGKQGAVAGGGGGALAFGIERIPDGLAVLAERRGRGPGRTCHPDGLPWSG